MKKNQLIIALGAAAVVSLSACQTHHDRDTGSMDRNNTIGAHGSSRPGGPMERSLGRGGNVTTEPM